MFAEAEGARGGEAEDRCQALAEDGQPDGLRSLEEMMREANESLEDHVFAMPESKKSKKKKKHTDPSPSPTTASTHKSGSEFIKQTLNNPPTPLTVGVLDPSHFPGDHSIPFSLGIAPFHSPAIKALVFLFL